MITDLKKRHACTSTMLDSLRSNGRIIVSFASRGYSSLFPSSRLGPSRFDSSFTQTRFISKIARINSINIEVIARN